ncbi:MAG: chorismate mutase [Rhodovibrionaceae bacterium]
MAKTPLDALRQEIDEIDSKLHDLLMRRCEVTAEVGRAKRASGATGQFLRPGREARVLRRLVARHQGGFPKAVLVRLWREIFAAATAQQGEFSICVLSGKGAEGLRDLARDHFGALTPISEQGSPLRVIHAVAEGEAQVGVLPLPEDGRDPWWRYLLGNGARPPRIVARLPFAPGPRNSEARALAIGHCEMEDTGEDRSFLIVESEQEVSRSTLRGKLDGGGLPVVEMLVAEESPGRWLHLVEVEGCVFPEDPRLAALSEETQELRLQARSVGGYALPLSSAALEA